MANDNLEDLKNCKRPAPSTNSEIMDIDDIIPKSGNMANVNLEDIKNCKRPAPSTNSEIMDIDDLIPKSQSGNMANDNLEDLKNCKRPAPSTNSEIMDIDDLIPKSAEKIRIGSEFQAEIQELLVLPTRRREKPSKKAHLLWVPTENILEVNEYILQSKQKYGYTKEQSLGMLYFHNYDIDRALKAHANFFPKVDIWTSDDKATFETACINFGKNFNCIQKMLLNKTIASLVEYYYLRKIEIKNNSVIDRQLKKLYNVRPKKKAIRKGSSSAKSESNNKNLYQNTTVQG